MKCYVIVASSTRAGDLILFSILTTALTNNHDQYWPQLLPPAVNSPMNGMSRPNQNLYDQKFVQGSSNTSSHGEIEGISATSNCHTSIVNPTSNRYHPSPLNQMSRPNRTLHDHQFVQGSSRDSLPTNYYPNSPHRLQPVPSSIKDLLNEPHTGKITEEIGGIEDGS
ncbi:hypothetical protein BDQ17DRAFT_726778 [Cyathus striatus]|nr:hypothetical protein BDQ17DRAFT_726778 [Cyathus striatus]